MSKEKDLPQKKSHVTIMLHVKRERYSLLRALNVLADELDVERNEMIWKVLEVFVANPSRPSGLASKTSKLEAKIEKNRKALENAQNELNEMRK